MIQDFERYEPLRQILQKEMGDKFSETSWLKIRNQWYRKFSHGYHSSSESVDEYDYLHKTNEGRRLLLQMRKWIQNNRKYVYEIKNN